MQNLMTQATYEKLFEEMKRIEEIEIPKLSKAKQAAAEEGDLKENAEYHACKEKLDQLGLRHENIKSRIMGATYIDNLRIPGHVVSVGTKVILEESNGDKIEYVILGAEDADLEKNIISIASPVAKGMIGKKEGDEVSIQVPDGVREFKILKIKYFKED